MYREHPLLQTPPDDTKLWRYTNLSQFFWLLDTRSLYFARLSEFDDKWEGILPTTSIEGLKRTEQFLDLKEKGHENVALYLLKGGLKADQLRYGVNCWHSNDVESVAMWKLYTQGVDGVAIQTTVDLLKKCFSKETRDLFIAGVQYLDHEARVPSDESVSSDPLTPIVTKRRSFRHESEVRVILERLSTRDSDEYLGFMVTTFWGENLTIDLSTLIEKIVVAPDYPAWAVDSLQKLVTAAGLLIEVETSDLLRVPETDEPRSTDQQA